MPYEDDLRRTLNRIDGRGYKAYKDCAGTYTFAHLTLHLDHVQGDPFAAPSQVRVRVPQEVAALPPELFETRTRRIALQDALARQVHAAIRQATQGHRGSGKSGMVTIDAGGQEVLERTAVVVTPQWVEARLEVGLPAAGRTVLGRQATLLLCDELPEVAEAGLLWRNLPQQEIRAFVACVENQEHIRAQLGERGLVAFVGNGAILPRESGASARPLASGQVVPFQSAAALEVTFSLPNPILRGSEQQTSISGMGIPQGVTLIVGGGYHGKSTLLDALEQGVYPHIPGDGREYVISTPDAVKIRAEDGRRVEQVDISAFISNLPYGRSTSAFSTNDASGSTSQAANIVEALEVGATALLLDEDTSATNFMVRDARMQALVHKEHEPITPFLDRVRELYDTLGVSTVLVLGGSGDYFDVADTVVMLRDYLPHEVSEAAREVARTYPTQRQQENTTPLRALTPRIPQAQSFDASRGKREVKINVRDRDAIGFGTDTIVLRAVEQLVDRSQTRAVGYALHTAAEHLMDGKATLREVLDALDALFDAEGLDALDPFRRGEEHPGNFARPRSYEVMAAINRLRTVQMRQAAPRDGAV
jgi:predicted ABC-class ATPase